MVLPSFLKQRKSKRTQKQQEKRVTYTDTNTLLGLIENGKQIEFRDTPKFINNEDRLKLAEAIVARYDPEEEDDSPRDNGDEDSPETVFPTPPRSPPHQTQEQWLRLLLEALSPDPRALRNLAEELIKEMGQDEMRQDVQQMSHIRILTYVMESDDRLCYDEDDMKQTLFHIAAINGARTALIICLSVIEGCCDGRHIEHAPGCKMVAPLLTSVDKEGYSPLSYATTKSKTLVVGEMLNLLGNTSSEDIQKLLKKAITSSSGNNVEIMRELLVIRPPASEKKYRADVLNQGILELAAKHFNPEVFEFLLDEASTVLDSPDCSLIHYVVYIGQVEAAKYLLKKFPSLATKLHVHPDHASRLSSNTILSEQKLPILAQGLASTVEVIDEEKFPVLALYNGEEDTELRDLIFEALMERLPISELREHLGGQTCKYWCQLYM